ncbi:MAG: TIGR02147 family protein [Fibrobacterota bacterium]
MKSIEHYCDYRQFLQGFYEEHKARFSFFSYRYFSRKAGLKSAALYQEVVAGKRNLTASTLECFIKGLNLSERESGFFRALVGFNQAETAVEKNRHLEEMRNLLPKIHEKTLPVSYYAYYSKWHNIAIRELACAFDWKGNYTLLGKQVRPQIGKREAREAVELLLQLGLLVKNADNTFSQSDHHLTSGSEVVSTTVRNVNQQFSQLGSQAIEAFPPTERDISGITMGVTHENYQLIKQEITAFKDRVKRIVANQEHMDRVYRLNLQLFPLSGDVRP